MPGQGAPEENCSACSAALMAMERVHVDFLRRLLGVFRSSPVQQKYVE